MGKGSQHDFVGLAMLVVAGVALVAACLGAFGSFGAWPPGYEAWQLGPLMASIALAAALIFYHRRETTRLRRGTTEREREVAKLEDEVSDLRRANEALSRNEARYRGAVAGLPVALFAVDGEGVFTLSEGVGLDALGIEPDKVVGRSIFEVHRDAPRIVHDVSLALAGKAFGTTVEVGGLVFETRYASLRENGEFSGVLGVVTDVTERKQAEDRLREAEARYRTLVEQIPAGVYIQGLEHEGGAIAYISPQIQDLLGYSPREYVETPGLWVETTHPEDRERVLAEVARTDETGEPFRMEFRKIARNGRVLWIRDEAVLVKDAEGNPLYWQGILLDITERKEAEEELGESRRRLSALLSNVSAYLYRCRNEPAWPNEFVSDYAFELTGHTPKELTDGSVMFADLIVEEDRERVWEEVQAGLADRRRFELRYSVRRKDGALRHVEERGQGVYGEGGAVEAIEGVVYDVTDRVRAEERLREAEERYRTLVERIPAVTFVDRVEGSEEPLYVSPQIEGMLGYTPEEWMAGRLWRERLHPEDRERVLASDERFEATGRRVDEQYRLLAKDGSVVWIREETVLVRGEGGKPLYVQGILSDISERKEAEERVRTSEAELRALFEAMTDLIFEIDWEGRYLKIAPTNPSLLYRPPGELLGKTLHEVMPEEQADMFRDHIRRALKTRRKVDTEYSLTIGDKEVWFAGTIAPMAEDRVVFVARDITERKALEKQLQHQAMHDPLTGLPNRILLTDRLRQALARAKRRRGEVAVLFLDLDNFKVVNDSLGHKAGDRLLVAASKRVRSVLRPEDTLARLGGDEFVLLLEDADAQEAVRVGQRVIERLREPLSLSGRRFVLTASIGVATGATGKHAADLLRDADLAMYRGKRSGKARVAVFEEAMNTEAIERLETEHDLRRAIEQGELRVHYQPQMLLDANLQRSLRAAGSTVIVSPGSSREPRVAGVEALVRWEHPQRGLLLPGQFVPLAEETGLIVPMGEAVLEEACRQAEGWQRRFAADPPLAVCVNLSARQFREPDLPETVSRLLRETDLDPTHLHLEITETTAMSDAPATVAMLEELKALGVRLVIDDFGTGYSSLSYLQRFPVDYVKIDRSFVADLEGDPGAVALVSGMIDLAHALGIKVIAEGVERASQLERLETMGCDLAQGYYFSSPLPSDAMDAFLEGSATG
jgi:diguanylate cyclase (GGDEF)-like protein/PAS domain S-box-containing protein